MASKGKIYYTDKDFSDAEVAELFGFPSIFILKNNSGQIVKHTAYDVTGAKSVTSFQASQDKVLTIGAITATTTSIDIELHSSGINSVEINGNTRTKNTPEEWTFPEVTEEKVFQIYAEDTPAIFGLAEDGEEIPAGALIVAAIALSEAGANITEAISGYREKIIDSWNGVYIPSGDSVLIISNYGLRYSLFGNTGVRIGGFYNYRTEPLYNGIPLSIKNDTGDDIEFFNLSDSSPNFIPINPADLPFSIKNGETANFAWNPAIGFEIIKTGSTPDLSGYATTPELDAEEVNRAAFDLIEKNERIAADNAEALARANADALKLDKPTAPNNVPTRVVNADNSTSDKGEFQLSEQIEIGTSQPAQASWRGKEVWVTASCTLTIPDPATLPAFWSIDVFVFAGTLTLAITSPGAWIGTAPANAPADSFFRVVRRGSINTFKVLGL